MRRSDDFTPPTPPEELLERVYRRGYRLRLRRRMMQGTSVAVMVGVVTGAALYGVAQRRTTPFETALPVAFESAPPGFSFPAVPVPAPPVSPLATQSPRREVASRVLNGGGAQADGESADAAISQTGRFVAFTSTATNLVAGDANGMSDVFVRDVETGRTELASVTPDGGSFAGGAAAASVSADGRFVAFQAASEPGGPASVYVRDRTGKSTRLVSPSALGATAAEAHGPVVSGDGGRVAFVSSDDALVAGDSNRRPDVFVRDLATGSLTRVSVSSSGEQADGETGVDGSLAISGDGRFVAFSADATNLVSGAAGIDVYLHDMQDRTTVRVSTPSSPELTRRNSFPALSADGRHVAYVRHVEGGTTTPHDIVLLWNRATKRETVVSVSSAEVPIDARGGVAPALSAEGRFITFAAASGRVFVRDRSAGSTAVVSRSARGAESSPCGKTGVSISGGGGYVAFDCDASNVVAADTNAVSDIFVRDRRRVTTVRASVATAR